MLKRMLSLAVALLLLCAAAHALAEPEKYVFYEDYDAFNLEIEIPEGAQHLQTPKVDSLHLSIWYDDPAKPAFDITVAFSEEMAGQHLGDLTEEETGHVMATVAENYSVPDQSFFVTPAGNTILFTREIDPDAGDYASMTTIYKGFFFSLYARYSNYAPLSDEDIALMHQIIESAWITDQGE